MRDDDTRIKKIIVTRQQQQTRIAENDVPRKTVPLVDYTAQDLTLFGVFALSILILVGEHVEATVPVAHRIPRVSSRSIDEGKKQQNGKCTTASRDSSTGEAHFSKGHRIAKDMVQNKLFACTDWNTKIDVRYS